MPFESEGHFQALPPDAQKKLLSTHLALGYHPESHDRLLVPQIDRYSGMALTGVQGSGKSGLLENMILQDIAAGHAVIVLDPHGDLITNCLAALPPESRAKTYLLDVEDELYPYGVNIFGTGPFKSDIERSQAINRIMHVFSVVWEDVLSQQHLPTFLRALTILLLDNPGATLYNVRDLLLNEPFRSRMLANVADESVRQFWTAYTDLSESEQLRRVQALINRLDSLFMGRSLVRNILGQRQSTISFRKAIEQKEHLFIRLPVKLIEQDARLIGTIIMAQIHAAVFSFGNLPEQKRPGVSIYIDESQNFLSKDVEKLFSEGRKFGTRLVVANQRRDQLPDYLRQVTTSVRTTVCFQLTPEDARELAHVFPAQAETIRPEDISIHPVEHLLSYDSDDPFVHTFIETYLRPLQQHKRGNRIEMDVYRYDWINNKPLDKPRVADPTPYLDSLLHQVMCSGNPWVRIPPEAVIGFANTGRNFYGFVSGVVPHAPVLQPTVCFPPALVVETRDGDLRWTRRPESATEQLFHFIFHLRKTMFALAKQPIGKKTAPSHTAVAQMLTQLPRRAAFVRSGETVGVIYTEETRPHAQGQELNQRIRDVLEQTRTKYARPKQEVEDELLHSGSGTPFAAVGVSAGSQPAILRWEDIEP